MELLVEQNQNLCNLYILPLIARKQQEFTGFINSYLDLENFDVVIEVSENKPQYSGFIFYRCSVTKSIDRELLFFHIPEEFHNDVASFVEGRYSTFSAKAKQYIRKYGKFRIRKNADGTINESVWLHVLDKTQKLKDQLEVQLGCVLPSTNELAEKPHKNNFL